MIIHIDMDAFYASVEVREQPALAGRPVVVGGTAEQRGVVAAANYVARRYGIHSAMPMVSARRRCAELVVLPVRMGLYAEVSQQIHAIFERFTPVIEPLSLDEAFLDVAGSERLFGDAERIARAIKTAIGLELGLVASVGVAPNKFIAKIASDVNKPDGFVVVPPSHVQAFLDPLPVSRLWGAGRTTQAALERLGIRTIAQLRRQPSALLADRFGKLGLHLWELAHGRDPRPVVRDRQAKSISNETTFSLDIADAEVVETWLTQLTEQVAWRLRRASLFARTIQLKVRFADFNTITRSSTLAQPTQSTDALWQGIRQLWRTRVPRQRGPVRLVGVGVSALDDHASCQGELFDESTAQQERIDTLTDSINARFGSRTVARGRGLSRTKLDNNGDQH
jgi:DNA polymerase-4